MNSMETYDTNGINMMPPDNKPKRKKSPFLITTIIFLITTLLFGGLHVVIIIKNNSKTTTASSDNTDMKYYTEEDILSAKQEERENILNLISTRLSAGDSTLSLLKEYYPDKVVYVNDNSNYVFADINPALAKTEYNKANYKTDDSGRITYNVDNNVVSHMGIDLSRYNSTVDFAKAKADGVEYAMIRCGYRAYGSGKLVQDTSFEKYISDALKNDVKVGVYFYTQAISKEEAVEEANYVLNMIKPYNVTYPVAIDVEAISNDTFRQQDLNKQELTDVVIAFCDTIKNAGYTPMIYCNLKYFMDNVDLTRLEDYDKWFAGYQTSAPYFPYKYSMWQYTSTGEIDGINGNVDINITMKTSWK